MKIKCYSFLLLLTVLQTGDALSEVVYDTFGPNASYNSNRMAPTYWNVLHTNSSLNVGLAQAAKFSVGSIYSLSSVTMALGYEQDTNNFAISIRADNAGAPTGALLEMLVSHPTSITGLYQVITFQSSLSPVLAPGASYWLVAEPIDYNLSDSQNNSLYEWYSSSVLGTVAARDFNFDLPGWAPWSVVPNQLLPAFRIDGIVIPEPSACSMVLIAAAVACFRRARR